MKVLVATRLTQGERRNDYYDAFEGELVRLPIAECSNPGCSCKRVFAGTSSRRATTTALVTERPEIDRDTLFEILADDMVDELRAAGFAPSDEVLGTIDRDAGLILRVVDSFASGSVVERRSGVICVRSRVWRRPR